MNEWIKSLGKVTEIASTIQGIVAIASFILSYLNKKKEIFNLKEEEIIGKIISSIGCISAMSVIIYYYTKTEPDIPEEYLMEIYGQYILLGTILHSFFSIIISGMITGLLMAIYLIIEKEGKVTDFYNLKKENIAIGVVRMIALPIVIYTFIATNYYVMVKLFRFRYSALPWILAPITPIIAIWLIAIIKIRKTGALI